MKTAVPYDNDVIEIDDLDLFNDVSHIGITNIDTSEDEFIDFIPAEELSIGGDSASSVADGNSLDDDLGETAREALDKELDGFQKYFSLCNIL